MREVLITSSVLILALLLLRQVFRRKIARRVQYALWGLVLIRLLVPVSLPALDFSVLTMTEPVRESITTRLEVPALTAPVVSIPNLQGQRPQNHLPETVEPTIPSTTFTAQTEPIPAETPAAKTLTLTETLGVVWLAGAGVMTVWLLVSNLAFAARLRNRRASANIPGCKYRVYMVESGLASPCLFGFPQPAIYLTPSTLTSEAKLRHVLAHEETHARHLDPLWSLLRSICLAIYWFNPLVWIAASASKTDCELACDESAIRRLGEEERLAYGKTLLSLIPIRQLPGNPLLSATTMSSDKKRLRDRITRIAENRKTRKLALCVMALLTAGTCVFTFAGCVERTADSPKDDLAPIPVSAVVERTDGPLSATELQYFNENFFNGSNMNIRNQFLTSMYDDPADIDLFELFYCGSGQGQLISNEEWAAYEAAEGFMDCDITRVSTAEADEVLLAYTGLTLAETKKVNLEAGFTYLPEFDAYFYGHGDTNYFYQVNITAGVREGDLIRLYYDDTFHDDGWKCVTLRELRGGRYWFVSNAYCENPIKTAVDHVTPDVTGPAQLVQRVWEDIQADESFLVTLKTGGTCHAALGMNRPGDLTADYTWESLPEDQVPDYSAANALTVGSGANTLTFYDGLQLVYCATDEAISWYRAAYTGPEDTFACGIYELFRRWYDEAELSAHREQNVIGDDGHQSREEIVRKWTDVHERTLLDLTEGSRYRCTYMDVRDIDLDYWNEVDTTEYKESHGAKDAFLFKYSAVFVPENDPHWFMAGNTAEYEGNDAPEGALQYWRCGYMYLMDDGWHCDDVGTGP